MSFLGLFKVLSSQICDFSRLSTKFELKFYKKFQNLRVLTLFGFAEAKAAKAAKEAKEAKEKRAREAAEQLRRDKVCPAAVAPRPHGKATDATSSKRS